MFLFLWLGQRIVLIWACLVILPVIEAQSSHVQFLSVLLQFIRVLLIELLDLVDWIKFLQNGLSDVSCCLAPKCKVFLRIRAEIAIEVEVFDSLAIALSFLAFHLQKRRNLLIPAIDEYLLLLSEQQELAHLEHVIL